MNVRFEEQNIRFKISEEELKQLMQGHIVRVSLGLLVNSMIALINPNALGEGMEVKQVLDGDTSYITLLVPSNVLVDLHNMGKNRDGIVVQQGELSLSLQVDVRKDSRLKEKAC
ncbi:MAG: hypothetical protein COB14_05130 [Alphaproteobacteria bacterium]|nr:MAG: hypothetical protein COB14_05130 [Alphaproteobacteria bacterium]